MEILLTGNTSFLTQEWLEEAFPNDHVLVTGSKGVPLSDLRIKTVALESKKLLEQLDTTYQFDRIVYFSEYLIPHSQREGELDQLRRVLQQCRERPVELIYFSGPESGLTPITSKSLLAKAAEELCLHYANTSKVQVKVFRCPYLYSTEAAVEKALGAVFRQLSEGTVRFDEQAQQPVFALCFEELASLVNRVMVRLRSSM